MKLNHLSNFTRSHYEEHYSEIILNKDRSEADSVDGLTAFLLGGAGQFGSFGKGHHKEHYCEIILNMDH